MYLDRDIDTAFHAALRSFPVVMVTGPRQSGKTTFVRHAAGEATAYRTFEDPLERDFARGDPRGFLARDEGSKTVILDEVQYVPELLSYIKMDVDEHRAPGRFVLTGSQQFELMQGVRESLAGRVAVLELLPLSYSELAADGERSLDDAIWYGGYPEPALMREHRDLWVRSYIRTYVERDVRDLLQIRDISQFEVLLGMCSARHAQELNYAALSRDAGHSQPTVKSWVQLLQASFVVHLLRPFFSNYGKRLVKSPKLYFIDPAVVATLTRQPSPDAALGGAMGGALFEGLVVTEALKSFAAAGRSPELYFWRSHDGVEVDLLVATRGGFCPVEIKLTSSPTVGHLKPLQRLRAIAGSDLTQESLLVCRVPETRSLPDHVTALPWQQFGRWVSSCV